MLLTDETVRGWMFLYAIVEKSAAQNSAHQKRSGNEGSDVFSKHGAPSDEHQRFAVIHSRIDRYHDNQEEEKAKRGYIEFDLSNCTAHAEFSPLSVG